jgi:hypothetical protein
LQVHANTINPAARVNLFVAFATAAIQSGHKPQTADDMARAMVIRTESYQADTLEDFKAASLAVELRDALRKVAGIDTPEGQTDAGVFEISWRPSALLPDMAADHTELTVRLPHMVAPASHEGVFRHAAEEAFEAGATAVVWPDYNAFSDGAATFRLSVARVLGGTDRMQVHA